MEPEAPPSHAPRPPAPGGDCMSHQHHALRCALLLLGVATEPGGRASLLCRACEAVTCCHWDHWSRCCRCLCPSCCRCLCRSCCCCLCPSCCHCWCQSWMSLRGRQAGQGAVSVSYLDTLLRATHISTAAEAQACSLHTLCHCSSNVPDVLLEVVLPDEVLLLLLLLLLLCRRRLCCFLRCRRRSSASRRCFSSSSFLEYLIHSGTSSGFKYLRFACRAFHLC